MRRRVDAPVLVSLPPRAPLTRRRGALAQLAGAFGGVVLSGCDPLICDCTAPIGDIGTFPYHPLVFHLDLAILAYQLHGQSLVWPFDPFYEERTHGVGVERDEFMARVRSWVQQQALTQAGVTTLDSYRGPGALAGFADNSTHDPILYCARHQDCARPWPGRR